MSEMPRKKLEEAMSAPGVRVGFASHLINGTGPEITIITHPLPPENWKQKLVRMLLFKKRRPKRDVFLKYKARA